MEINAQMRREVDKINQEVSVEPEPGIMEKWKRIIEEVMHNIYWQIRLQSGLLQSVRRKTLCVLTRRVLHVRIQR